MIKVIGKESCSRCEMVKNILSQKNIEFTYSLLEEYDEEIKKEYILQARKKGFLNMPLIIRNNEMIDIKEVTE